VKPILSPHQAAGLDRRTQALGITADLLMERAGRAVARAAVDLCGGVYGRRAVVLCGKGNNGGDGLVAARHLARWGMRVSVEQVGVTGELREPAATNAKRLEHATGVRVRAASAASLERELARADVAIDALFGTGFRGTPEDLWAEAIEELNNAVVPTIAVDIPSGVNGATGAVEGEAVRADLTVTFGAAKAGAVLMPGAEFAGAVRVVDIGFPAELIEADTFLIEPSDVVAAVPVRAADSHKRAAGVLLIVAGSRGMSGAVALIARAAMRLGTGLVTVAVPQGILPVVQAMLEEATFLPLAETAEGTIAASALDDVLERLGQAHALAIGPGVTTQPETAGFMRDLIRACPVPLVADADALNAFTDRAADLADRKSEAVLTPHAGEFARLMGTSPREQATDRLAGVRALAKATGAVALLKGSRSLIAEPGGVVRINPTGSSVLATAGSGDVLTGAIGGLLARGVAPAEAAASAAYLHGLAGILSGAIHGEGTVAGDLVELLPQALAKVSP
jgi:NAD(P)H-hydrate epimerase